MLRGWLNDHSDPISLAAPAVAALLSVVAGGLAFSPGNDRWIGCISMLAGLASALGVWATGAASKARDKLAMATAEAAHAAAKQAEEASTISMMAHDLATDAKSNGPSPW